MQSPYMTPSVQKRTNTRNMKSFASARTMSLLFQKTRQMNTRFLLASFSNGSRRLLIHVSKMCAAVESPSKRSENTRRNAQRRRMIGKKRGQRPSKKPRMHSKPNLLVARMEMMKRKSRSLTTKTSCNVMTKKILLLIYLKMSRATSIMIMTSPRTKRLNLIKNDH